MTTIVCQGLQTCLESELNETRTLRLKLASPKQQFSQALDVLALKASNLLDSNTNQLVDMCPKTIQKNTNQLNKNPDRGGWSFFQDIFLNSCKDGNGKQEGKVYVHPSMKSSSSRLSERSLQMCTENLGNETGTDMADSDSSIFSFMPSLDYDDTPKLEDSPTWEQQPKSFKLSGTKKVISRDIPPPLTTIRGSKSLRVKPHREDGRLVIEAIEAPSTRTCFEAERIDGRLKLRLVKDCIPEFESNEEMDAEEDDEQEEEFEIQADEDEADGHCCMEREVDADKISSGTEMKIEKFTRACGCKEGKRENNGLLNWEPFWVAT